MTDLCTAETWQQPSPYCAGARVRHATFGYGDIVNHASVGRYDVAFTTPAGAEYIMQVDIGEIALVVPGESGVSDMDLGA